MLHSDLAEKIIACAYTVYNRMGYGYLESVYERCMLIELAAAGSKTEAQKPLKGLYYACLAGTKGRHASANSPYNHVWGLAPVVQSNVG